MPRTTTWFRGCLDGSRCRPIFQDWAMIVMPTWLRFPRPSRALESCPSRKQRFVEHGIPNPAPQRTIGQTGSVDCAWRC